MSTLSRLLKKIEKGTPERRCMTCKWWKGETEFSGKCMKSKNPIYKHPNYVCKDWGPAESIITIL